MFKSCQSYDNLNYFMKKIWSKENLEKIIKDCYSIADVLKKLKLKWAGGNYYTVKKYIQLYNLDISHFTGQYWHNNPNISIEDKKVHKIDEILKENTNFKSDNLKKRLIEEGYKHSFKEKAIKKPPELTSGGFGGEGGGSCFQSLVSIGID